MMKNVAQAVNLVRGPSLTILMYHAVIEEPLPLRDFCFIRAEDFAAQMSRLAKNGTKVLPLADAVASLKRGELTGPTISITFDDGYRNNVGTAMPVLQQYGFPATIFLATGSIGTEKALWPCRLNIAVEATKLTSLSLHGAGYPLHDRSTREETLRALKERVKVSAGDDPAGAVDEIERALDVAVDPSVPRSSPYAMLDQADIETAVQSGLIEFGGHTVSHPIMSRLSDAQLDLEITDSLEAVKQLTAKSCRTFAYPNGRAEDYDERAVRLLNERGIEAAVTTAEGINRRHADPLRLRRVRVGPNFRSWQLEAAASGLPISSAITLARRARALMSAR